MTRLAIAHAWEPDEVCDRAIFVCHTCGVYNKNMDTDYMGTDVFISHKACRKRHCCMKGCDVDHFIMESFMTFVSTSKPSRHLSVKESPGFPTPSVPKLLQQVFLVKSVAQNTLVGPGTFLQGDGWLIRSRILQMNIHCDTCPKIYPGLQSSLPIGQGLHSSPTTTTKNSRAAATTTQYTQRS